MTIVLIILKIREMLSNDRKKKITLSAGLGRIFSRNLYLLDFVFKDIADVNLQAGMQRTDLL